MKRISFVFGVHLHQPVGNFDWVMEEAVFHAYLPFLKTVAHHPEFRFSLHISGPLWDYFSEKHREIFDIVGEMVARSQVELVGGGYYEPILAVIPRRDALGQLKMMSNFLEKNFSSRPRGIWLTERIWEPFLPSILYEAGVEYTAVDDYHLKSIGITGDDLLGYYVTEDDAHPVAIFPISEELRYAIPFDAPEKTIEYLSSRANDWGGRVAIIADDGEKFGLWPGTYDWVYKDGWLEKFLKLLESNLSWINLQTFSEVLDSHRSFGRVYLPTASYFEMNEWTLPAELAYRFHILTEELKKKGRFEEVKPFLKGGYWRNFLSKYPESDRMHKRMTGLSSLLHSLEGKLDKNSYEKSRLSLYRSQVNCAYWHGIFGGLYLPHLRDAIFENILEGERQLVPHLLGDAPYLLRVEDMNADREDEIQLTDGRVSLWFMPRYGGSLFEIDALLSDFCVTNTVTRRREGYHKLVPQTEESAYDENEHKSIHELVTSKERNLYAHLFYDWYTRYSLLDHIMPPDETVLRFRNCQFAELGDFVNQPYDFDVKESTSSCEILFSRNGGIWREGKRYPFGVEKRIRFTPGKPTEFLYTLKNGDTPQDVIFGVEFNFGLLTRDDPSTYILSGRSLRRTKPSELVELSDVHQFRIVVGSKGVELVFKSDEPVNVWSVPIETVSISESGFERLYQGNAILFHRRFSFAPDEQKGFSFAMEIKQRSKGEEQYNKR